MCICVYVYVFFFKYGVNQYISFLFSNFSPFPLPKLCVKFVACLPKEACYFLSAQ